MEFNPRKILYLWNWLETSSTLTENNCPCNRLAYLIFHQLIMVYRKSDLIKNVISCYFLCECLITNLDFSFECSFSRKTSSNKSCFKNSLWPELPLLRPLCQCLPSIIQLNTSIQRNWVEKKLEILEKIRASFASGLWLNFWAIRECDLGKENRNSALNWYVDK